MNGSAPPVRRFSARGRRREIGILLPGLLSAVLIAVGAWAFDPFGVPVLTVAYCAVIAMLVLLVGLVVAFATLRRLPTVTQNESGPAAGATIHAWRGQWWVMTAFRAVMGGALIAGAALGLREGGDLALLAMPAGALGVWILGIPLLIVLGRRHNESLSVGTGRLVHRASWGSESCPLAVVTGVEPSLSDRRLVITSRDPLDRTLSPWPWRTKPPSGPREMDVDTYLMGHSAHDLAAWLRTRVPGLGQPEPDSPDHRSTIADRVRGRFGGQERGRGW